MSGYALGCSIRERIGGREIRVYERAASISGRIIERARLREDRTSVKLV